jgi:hypothetical protein
MERALEIYVLIQITIIGLSHIVQHRAWAEFFVWLRSKGDAGVFANGMLNLMLGSMIVAFHRVWSGIPLIITVFGILNLVKAAQCLIFPQLSRRTLSRVSVERSRMFVAPGYVFLGLAGVIGYWLANT